MSSPVLTQTPPSAETTDDVHNVVDLTWLALISRLREAIAQSPLDAMAVDADKLHRHLELLTLYKTAATTTGYDPAEWSAAALKTELEAALAELPEPLREQQTDSLEPCSTALRLLEQRTAPPGQLLDLADQCFGVLVSLESGLSQSARASSNSVGAF